MLTLKDKKEKNIPSAKNIYHCFGAIEGTVKSYKLGIVDLEHAMSDIEDIIEHFEKGTLDEKYP